MKKVSRCNWGEVDALMQRYHDTEWGVPIHDDQKLFEFLILDAFQAGLSWAIILNKRRAFKKAFSNFNPYRIAKYNNSKVRSLLNNSDIVRNKLKINSTVDNAKAFIDIKKEFKSFDTYIWQFVNGDTIINSWNKINQIPASTKESDAMSYDLKKRGFKFVGSTICYAFMQASGMVNDHVISCFRYNKV